MKLALGTVQFGLDYGAFNTAGKIAADEASLILDMAQNADIGVLDTARAYGDSEHALGALGAANRFAIITKVRPQGDQGTDATVSSSIVESLSALSATTVDGLLFHSASDLLGDKGKLYWQAAEEAKSKGDIQRVGVSVYSPDEALEVLDRFPIELVQLPVSIFDQRVLQTGALSQLKDNGVEVHARSAFLQGFALAHPDALPPALVRSKDMLELFIRHAQASGLTQLKAALGFVCGQPLVDKVVVGVQSAAELNQLVEAALEPAMLPDAHMLASDDQVLLNPSRWRD